jgi:hypothetical protein
MAVECGYRPWEIDGMRFTDALKLADYWAVEPPLPLLYYKAHFRDEDDRPEGGMQPNLQGVPYAQLSEALKYSVRKTWLNRHPGKTEKDFFAALKAKADAKYGKALDEARRKKSSGDDKPGHRAEVSLP